MPPKQKCYVRLCDVGWKPKDVPDQVVDRPGLFYAYESGGWSYFRCKLCRKYVQDYSHVESRKHIQELQAFDASTPEQQIAKLKAWSVEFGLQQPKDDQEALTVLHEPYGFLEKEDEEEAAAVEGASDWSRTPAGGAGVVTAPSTTSWTSSGTWAKKNNMPWGSSSSFSGGGWSDFRMPDPFATSNRDHVLTDWNANSASSTQRNWAPGHYSNRDSWSAWSARMQFPDPFPVGRHSTTKTVEASTPATGFDSKEAARQVLAHFSGSFEEWLLEVRKAAKSFPGHTCEKLVKVAQINLWQELAAARIQPRAASGGCSPRLPTEIVRMVFEFLGPIPTVPALPEEQPQPGVQPVPVSSSTVVQRLLAGGAPLSDDDELELQDEEEDAARRRGFGTSSNCSNGGAELAGLSSECESDHDGGDDDPALARLAKKDYKAVEPARQTRERVDELTVRELRWMLKKQQLPGFHGRGKGAQGMREALRTWFEEADNGNPPHEPDEGRVSPTVSGESQWFREEAQREVQRYVAEVKAKKATTNSPGLPVSKIISNSKRERSMHCDRLWDNSDIQFGKANKLREQPASCGPGTSSSTSSCTTDR